MWKWRRAETSVGAFCRSLNLEWPTQFTLQPQKSHSMTSQIHDIRALTNLTNITLNYNWQWSSSLWTPDGLLLSYSSEFDMASDTWHYKHLSKTPIQSWSIGSIDNVKPGQYESFAVKSDIGVSSLSWLTWGDGGVASAPTSWAAVSMWSACALIVLSPARYWRSTAAVVCCFNSASFSSARPDLTCAGWRTRAMSTAVTTVATAPVLFPPSA